MAAVTWRCVLPDTCHVPPREPFEKCCVRVAAKTGSGREPKLSGQKRLGLNCVSMGESAPRGQNCAPRGQFYFFSLLPSSSDTLEPRDPKFGTRVHVSKGYLNIHNLGVQKLWGQNFGFLEFFENFCICLSFFIIRPKMLKMTFFENSKSPELIKTFLPFSCVSMYIR